MSLAVFLPYYISKQVTHGHGKYPDIYCPLIPKGISHRYNPLHHKRSTIKKPAAAGLILAELIPDKIGFKPDHLHPEKVV